MEVPDTAPPAPPAGLDGPWPVLQAALDFLELDRALALAGEAAAGGIDWLEAGTPLLKSEGLAAVRKLRAAFPRHVIVADMKTMDAGRAETEAAARAGAGMTVCLAAAADATIAQCVAAGASHGIRVMADTIGLADGEAVRRAVDAARMGVDAIGVHLPVDEQMRGGDPLALLAAVVSALRQQGYGRLPVAVAGGVTESSAAAMAAAGASVIIVGGALHKAPDAARAARRLRGALAGSADAAAAAGLPLGRPGDEAALARLLEGVSSSNLSDALHHRAGVRGLLARTPGLRAAGPAFTVRTVAGDWNKVVRAIDLAPAGSVLAVEAGAGPPAVWGELATRSALARGLAGAVIDGATRDSDAARPLGFPLWSRVVCPDAGEPRGVGEIGATIRLGGQAVRPGDWLVADDDGVIALPRAQAVEYANRARDILENEERLRAEIAAGSTLARAARLERWEAGST